MKSLSCVILSLASSFLFASQGTVPPATPAAYPAHIVAEGGGLGAILLKEAQIKQRFVSDVGRDFLVVEVGVYPKEGSDLLVEPDHFILHAGENLAVRPESPRVIAAVLQKSEESKHDIVVVPHVGVGYESGRGVYDPTTGTVRRGGGIYTSTGVIVMTEPSPGVNPRNEETSALELTEKGLPGGTFTKPVAGHLYFRVDKKIRKDSKTKYSLTFDLAGKETTLELKR
jgi:hypothetical protein